jgi:hypothetical protein
MAMKKTSGGDSPLRQDAGKSFWTLPIFGSTAAADRDVFWKSDQVFRSLYAKGHRQKCTEATSHVGGADYDCATLECRQEETLHY